MMAALKPGYILQCPVAHGEGRFMFPPGQREELLGRLYDMDMLVWRYVRADGSFELDWPENPNGTYHDIAGICNPEGKVLGLMPRPERAYYGYLMPEWTKERQPPRYGDGYPFFKSIVDYVEKEM